MISIKTVTLVAIAFLLTFVGVSWYLGSLPQLTQKALSLFEGSKQLFSPIINGWNSLPSSVRSVVMLGIPTLAATFFAWTKSRAMTKLQQTEQQAATQATQLTGQLTQAQATAGSTLQENMDLKSQLAVYEKDGDAVTALKEINMDLQSKLSLEIDRTKQVATERDIIQREYQTLLEKVTSDPYLKKILQT
jgi:hypothetical protein